MKKALMAAAIAVASSYSAVAIAQVAPAPLSAYGELPKTEDIALSPGGSLAMIATIKGQRMMLLLDNTMKLLNSVEVGDIKVRDIDWVGEEAVVVTRTDTQELGDRFIAENSEFANAMVVPVDVSKPVTTIFADDRSMMNAVFGEYGYRRIDGEWYGFYGGIKMERNQAGNYFWSGTPAALFRVNLSDNRQERISETPGRRTRHDWLLDGNGEIAAELVFSPEANSWRIRNSRGSVIAEGRVEDKGGAALRAFGHTPGTALYSTRNDEEADLEWFEVSLDGGDAPDRIFEDIEIHSIRVDPATNKIIGFRVEGERYDSPGDWTFYDQAIQTEADKIYGSFAHVNGSIRGFTPDFNNVVVHTDGNSDSGTWYLIDTVAKSASTIAKSYPEIRPNQVGPISTFDYTAQDGTKLDGILTLPPGREASNLPLILLPHGGPRSHDLPHFDWWAQAFASRGYAVFQPNFRGSTNRDKDFIDAGNGEWGKKMQTDISDGMTALAEKGIVDPSRACIMGASYGGYAAMAGITLQQGVYRCSVAVAGVSDLKRMVDRENRETGSRTLKDFREETIGPIEQMDSISPRNFADQADAPILLIHGRDDTVVPYEQSEMMAKALEKAGKPYQFLELKGEDHWLSRSVTRNQMLETAVKFVIKYNPPD